MTPETIIRRASLGGLDLNVRDGQLYARPRTAVPDDLLATVTAYKAAILHDLTAYHAIHTLCVLDMRRCLPLTPADLTPDERREVETLAGDLRTTGGLGQFVCDLWDTWHELSARDRLAAVVCWQLAAGFPLPPTGTDGVWTKEWSEESPGYDGKAV